MKITVCLCLTLCLHVATVSAQQSKRFDSLQQKMVLAYSMGKYQQAADLCQLSLLYAREDLGENHIEVGNQYANIGLMLKSMNKFDSAAWYYEKANDFFVSNGQTGKKDYVDLLTNKGTLASARGKGDSAIYWTNKAMSACGGIKECNASASYPTLLNNLANLYMKENRNREAESVLLEADKSATGLKLDNQQLGLLIKNSLGLCYINLMEYPRALNYLLQIHPVFSKRTGPASPGTISIENNIFLCYYKMGEKLKADSLGKILNEKIDKQKDKTQSYTFLSNYALMLTDLGQLEEADKVYNTLLEVMGKVFGEDHPDYRLILNNHIILLQDLGQFNRAYASSKKLINAIQTKGSNIYFEGLVTNNYISNLLELDSMDQAIASGTYYLEKTKSDSSANIGEIKGAVCLNMAVAWQRKTEYKKSLGFINQAITYTGTKPSIPLIVLYQHKAILLQSDKNYSASLAALEQALSLVKKLKLENGKLHRRILYNMASSYTESGQVAQAATRAKQLLAIHQQQLINLLDYLTPTEREYFVNNTLEDLDYLLDFYLYAENKFPRKYINNFLEVLLFREGLLLKTQTSTKKAILQSNDSLLLGKYHQLQTLKTNWIYQLQLPPDKQKNVAQMEKEILQLEKEIQSAAKAVKEKTTDWKKISEGLQKEEAYIHYYQAGAIKTTATGFVTSNKECYAVVLRKNAAPELLRVDTDKKITSFFKNTSATSRVMVSSLYERNDSTAFSLYQLLWKPLEKHLAGVKRIYLRTNGDMNRISFAAIPLPGGKTVSDNFTIRRLITFADSSFNWDDQPGRVKNILLIGDVNFNSSKKRNQRTGEGQQWELLPATRNEITTIQSLLQPKGYTGTLITDSLATEEAVKKAINSLQPAILHIATHGFFTRKTAKQENAARLVEKGVFSYSDLGYLQSGIVLAGANDYQSKTLLGNDGILNAYELQQLNFQHTDLVVLSACETALGNIDRQEGVYGLQRSFKIAGAKYQILSLWKIPDQETQQLMNLFYQELAQGKTYEEAFNTAQGMMKKKYDPYFWAGFVLLK